ncbi:MAG: Gfo/Idh/MocA family protein [Planctomycetota bacterium]|jgi:predicted dehydrogenase
MFFERLNGKCRAGGSVTRRRFMKGAGVAALSFTIMKPSLVRGMEANSRPEVGVIGLGGRGKWIAGLIEEHGGYQITSVADYFAEVANAAGEQFKVSKERRFSGLSGYKKLIESKPDAVFLETPPYCFGDHVTAAVEAGCHVYIAKPLACDVAGCLTVAEMGRKATAAGKVFLVDFQTRTDPFFVEGIKRVHRGDIGKIGMLSSIYTDDAFPDPPKTATIESRLQRLIWTNDVALGGGMIVNCDIHAIDVALWLAGKKPISATGSARVAKANPNGDTNYLYSVTYEFEDGVILNHRGEHLRNRKGFSSDCDAYCQEGFLETAYDGQLRMLGNKTGYRGGKVENLYPQGAIRNIATFHKSIINKIYDNPTLEPSVNCTLATILGRQAAHRNTRVTWDEMIKENEKIEVDFTGLKE